MLNNLNYNISLTIFLLILFITPCHKISGAVTAEQILNETAAKIKKSNGIDCKFTLSMGTKKIYGEIKMSKNKFAILSSSGSSWYNGKYLWTYAPGSNETTVMVPTQLELNEVNPINYLSNYGTSFSVAFASNHMKGKYVIELTPKKKNNQYKKITIVISGSKTPESFSIISADNKKTEIIISSLSLKSSFSAPEFEYPKTKYPKADIIDLR